MKKLQASQVFIETRPSRCCHSYDTAVKNTKYVILKISENHGEFADRLQIIGGNRAINLNFAQFAKIIYLLKASSLLKSVTWGRGAPGNFPVSRWASPLLVQGYGYCCFGL